LEIKKNSLEKIIPGTFFCLCLWHEKPKVTFHGANGYLLHGKRQHFTLQNVTFCHVFCNVLCANALPAVFVRWRFFGGEFGFLCAGLYGRNTHFSL